MRQALNKIISAALTKLYKQLKLQVKLYKQLKLQVSVQIAIMRMKIGIRAVNEIHKYSSKKYLDKDYKKLKQYIILLDRVFPKKKYTLVFLSGKIKLHYKITGVEFQERLFWINFKNFKKIKKEGWLPKAMNIWELEQKAFYTSSMYRTYEQEYKAKTKAINKYVNYLKTPKP